MPFELNLKQERRHSNDNYGKIYAAAANKEPIDLVKLADHMAEHNSPYSKGIIVGVLTDMVRCIRELITANQPVKLPNLAIFYAQVVSEAANTPADFSITENVKGLRLKCVATGDLSVKPITRAGSESGFVYTDLAQKIKDGLVEISTLYPERPSGGDDSGGGGDDGEPDPVRP